jgi:hypothetical protein
VNLTSRQQWLAVIAIAGVVFFVGDRILFTPLANAWSARSKHLHELKENVRQSQLLVDREVALRSRWENMQTNLLAADPSAAERQVLKAFDRWSQESRIGVTAIKPQWKQTQDDETRLECRVDAFGNLAAVTRFLYEIEQDPLAVKIDSLELTSRNDTGDEIALTLQVSGLLATSATQ